MTSATLACPNPGCTIVSVSRTLTAEGMAGDRICPGCYGPLVAADPPKTPTLRRVK